MSMGNIISVSFCGDLIQTINEDGQISVAVRSICQSLGINWVAQYQRLKRHPLRSTGVILRRMPSKNGYHPTVCLHIEFLSGWLDDISPDQVKPKYQSRLNNYQRRCYQALSGHLMSSKVSPPVSISFIKTEAVAFLPDLELQVLAAYREWSKNSGSSAPTVKIISQKLDAPFEAVNRAVQLLTAIGVIVFISSSPRPQSLWVVR